MAYKSNIVEISLALEDWMKQQSKDVGGFQQECGSVCWPVYSPSGALRSTYCVLFWIEGHINRPARLMGGLFPDENQIVCDAGGWIFARVDFAPDAKPQDVVALCNATLANMRALQTQQYLLPTLIDKVKAAYLRARRMVAIARAA